MLTRLKHFQISLYLTSLGTSTLIQSNGHAFLSYDSVKNLNKRTEIYNPLDNIVWTEIGDYGNVLDIGSRHYLDVISHTDPNDSICPRASGMAFAQASVRIHETQHMLHCQIQRLSDRSEESIEGLYYQNGHGIIFKNPKVKVTDFASLIPQELREIPSPYQTYIIDQMQYPSLNNIGYLFNEWASYRSNIILNLQFEKAGIPEPDLGSHAANYAPHFFGYLAIAMHHLRLVEPEALNDKQLKATFALYAESTWQLMHEALTSPVFGADDTFYGSRIRKVMSFYRDSEKFEDVKNSLIEIYGEQWVNKLME